MLRSLAVWSADLSRAEQRGAFSTIVLKDVTESGERMTTAERHMAIRSLGTMSEFAQLENDSRAILLFEAESAMFGQIEPAAQIVKSLTELVSRHAKEWKRFKDQFPEGGWAQAIVRQL